MKGLELQTPSLRKEREKEESSLSKKKDAKMMMPSFLFFVSGVVALMTPSFALVPGVGHCGRMVVQEKMARVSSERQRNSVGILNSKASGAYDVEIDFDTPENKVEYRKVEFLSRESCELELNSHAIPVFDSESDMDVRLKLLETRIRLKEADKPPEPGPNDPPFQKLVYKRPDIWKYTQKLYDCGDINSYNVFIEYVTNATEARMKYGSEQYYRDVMDRAQAMMDMEPFKSKIIDFAGFPASMGEEMIKLSLAEFGPLESIDLRVNPKDPDTMTGRAIFQEQSAADKAVEMWNEADMGLGTVMSLKYVDESI